MESKKLMFLIPFNNVVLANSVTCLLDTIMNLQKRGHLVYVNYINDTMVHHARDRLASRVHDVTKTPIDYIIWLDSDQTDYDADTVERLIASFERNEAFDMLSALYFSRDYPSGGVPKPIALVREEDGLYTHMKDWSFGEVKKVDVVGFGMLIMPPSVLNMLYVKHGNLLFCPQRVDEHHIKGEDVVFCEFAKESHLDLGVDCGIVIGHGFYTVNKNVYEGMKHYHRSRTETI
jgi:hypothetical protein